MRDLIIVLIVFGMLPMVLMRPYIGIYLWYWIGLMNPHKLSYGFAFNFPFAQAIAIATLLAMFNKKYRHSIPWDTGLILMIVMFIYVTFTSFFAWNPDAAWEYWDRVLKIFLFSFLSTMLITGRVHTRILLLVIVLSLAFYGVRGGIFSIITGGNYRVWGPPGRVFISSNNFLGLAMIMVFPLLFELAKDFSKKWIVYLFYGMAGLTAIAIIFTYSRGALLGFLSICALMIMKSKKKGLILFILIPIIAVAAVKFVPEKLYKRAETIETFEEDSSAMQRIRAWQVAFAIALESPFTGAGFEFESGNEARWFGYLPDAHVSELGDTAHVAHSTYFQVLGQHGFVMLIIYLWLLLYIIMKCQRFKRFSKQNDEVQWIGNYATGIQYGVIGYMVSGAFLNVAYFDLLYAYVGVVAILGREQRKYLKQKADEEKSNFNLDGQGSFREYSK